MRKISAGLFVLALATFAGPALAADVKDVQKTSTENRSPNFFGSTGLLGNPSAYVQGNRQVSLFVGGNEDLVGGGAVGGILDRLEVGFSIQAEQSGGNDTDVFANAKFQILKEKKNMPAIAVGVVDAFDTTGLDPSVYVVASKYFTRSEIQQRFALKGHLGYGTGVYGKDVLAGAEVFYDRHLSAIAEYQDGDVNIGARYTWKAFTGTIALFDLSRLGGLVSYTFRLK